MVRIESGVWLSLTLGFLTLTMTRQRRRLLPFPTALTVSNCVVHSLAVPESSMAVMLVKETGIYSKIPSVFVLASVTQIEPSL